MPSTTRTVAGSQLTTPANLAAICGVLAGVGGAVHGVGEIAQGQRRVDGIVIDSWASGPIADNLGGEPAMTLAPTLFTAGVATLATSLALAVWAASRTRRNSAGGGLTLLSLAMLLAGGGFGPPVLGALAGLVAYAGHQASGTAIPTESGPLLGRAWTPLFWFCTANAAFLVLGSNLTAVALDLRIPDAFVYSLFLVVLTMPVTALAARGQGTERHHANSS